MKSLIFRSCIVLALISIVNVASGADSIEAQLKKVAAQTVKNLPTMLNENIQATSIAAVGKTLLLRYNFTQNKAALDVIALKTEYYRNSINAASTNPDMQKLLKNGASLDYQYYDAANEFVMQYTIDAKACKLTK